ncbi:Flp family type IVb pilin [Enterovibrio norvegicus]|uniref:Fimbrial protein n=1 Tax=Enterovibrio norvegicus TaxID=188144 RepID=A0A2N7L809_9GAMM|nr:Flp family type IVb pilin [Enterovibrio norvegicus]PMN71909.1 fimbrial protein [Enterovibrio norvegicus]PMN90259.1 fimbrial protein [Enterovibrio norvegicus]
MSIFQTVKNFINDERGVTAIEYAIIGVAISAIVAATFTQSGPLGEALTGAITTITSNITNSN